MITLYGIPNCDTVKKARAWLAEHGLDHQFHDFKKQGVPPERLQLWMSAVGWETLLNRKGTMWRKLDAATQATVVDDPSAAELMRTQSSVIKRPVVEWTANSKKSDITVGFKPEDWSNRL
ncbi:MAG TPA: arsenate reductase [Burkholderiaceae bacterium]|nr:arsenate reductase [Burkholderiaceae bacterium]